ncbi:CHC2 zinc finger domain-containing protein [Phenylobacterium sp.]|uniref:DUF7146 domain-containing protein n=1 Tax=Phenylobacterium sp. TaxID=1871053 RepID=UPI0035AEC5AF
MTVYASAARTAGLFDAARGAITLQELTEREGVKLRRSGHELRGGCPLCGAGAKSASPPFAIKLQKETFRCYGCGAHGDVVDLERELRGGTPAEAARRLTGGDVPHAAPRPRAAVVKAADKPSTSERVAAELLREARVGIEGTLAARYLAARGAPRELIAAASPNLRYHPHAKWGWDAARGAWITAPAMLAQVVTASGPTGGVHATYLARDGQGKAALAPAKRMWGAQLDREGRPGGAWLIGPSGEGDLVVAEGIETALSVAALAWRAGVPMRACAALSLNRLQGGLARDDDGRIDPFEPQPDPASPPFTWPPIEDCGEVVIGVDRDMSEVRVKGRSRRGKTCWFNLTPEARARLCGRLAVAGWRAAGWGRARAIAPPMKCDFNDELRRVLARERGE